MIRFIPYDQIDKKRWDKAVTESSNPLPFALSWYLDVVTNNQWDAMVMNDYEAICPIVSKKKLGVKYVFTPFFINQLGVFFKGIEDRYSTFFLEQICSQYKYVDTDFNFYNNPKDKAVKVSGKAVQYINLELDYDQLSKRYSSNVKRNLQKSFECEFKVADVSVKQVVAIFKENAATKIKTLKGQHLLILDSLLEKIVKTNSGFCVGVYDESKNLLAAGAFTDLFGRIIFIKGGVSELGRKQGAMHFLFDTIIRKYSMKRSMLDFGGSSVPGVARFYKSFGALDYNYPHIKFNRLPLPLKLIKK